MIYKRLLALALIASAPIPSSFAQSTAWSAFQVAAPFAPEYHVASDMAIVYGVTESFESRVAAWKEQGYRLGFMTGIAWGNYDAYYGLGDSLKRAEIQTDSFGKLFMHGDSDSVGYNVPTPAYVEFIKDYIRPAIRPEIEAIFLEEPEFWARTGWSEAFKEAWQEAYGVPWQPPNAKAEYQYKASLLKYKLYQNALREVFGFAKAEAARQGHTVQCYVPTHSLLNYAHWRIVSPESLLLSMPEVDGIIAQVWTGTARTPNFYKGLRKERTFETAFLEYGQMAGMVTPWGKELWYLTDPVEDNPNHTWDDYRLNYEATLAASLLWPEVSRFEVMPWPDRIFRGTYPAKEGADAADAREGIPKAYAAELLTLFNALNSMEQQPIRWDTGTPGIGIAVSDSLMFQRADPYSSDNDMGHIYALALPLLKAGIPVRFVQLEAAAVHGVPADIRTLLLSYEGQKPRDPRMNEAVVKWVRAGGCLLYVGDDSDPYHRVPEWWNEEGAVDTTAFDHLAAALELPRTAYNEPVSAGSGYVRVFEEKPQKLQRYALSAEKILGMVRDLHGKAHSDWKVQSHLLLERGPWTIAAVLDEAESAEALQIAGPALNLFNPALTVQDAIAVKPGERVLLADLGRARTAWGREHVLAASARVLSTAHENNTLTVRTLGPTGTPCKMLLQLAAPPASVQLSPPLPFEHTWDAAHGILTVTFENQARTVDTSLSLGAAAN
ncbi:MAG: hypothetical protein HYV27_10930 [Candidatus Hydrogenedentes bacterium]|nr:hypothetical protein [Candidatus Hydrogenedentota bacterium]